MRRRAPNTTTAKSRKRRNARVEERCIRKSEETSPRTGSPQEKTASDISSDSPGFTQAEGPPLLSGCRWRAACTVREKEKENLG